MADLYLADKAAFDAAVAASSETPLLIDFTASWCPPCQRIAPIFERLAGENAGSVTLKKVDVDNNAEAAQAAGIQCMPTFKVYKNGAEIEKMEGASEQGLNDLIARAKA